MSLPRKIEIKLPSALPKNLEPTINNFFSQILSVLQIKEGINTEHKFEKTITRRDLELLGIDTSVLDQ